MPSGLEGSQRGGARPVTVSFALLVLGAGLLLVLLRYFYGAIRIEGGVR